MDLKDSWNDMMMLKTPKGKAKRLIWKSKSDIVKFETVVLAPFLDYFNNDFILKLS